MPDVEDEAPAEGTEAPGFYTDAYLMNFSRSRIRIAFAEYIEKKSYYRTAVVMPVEDAEDLAKDILDAVKKLKERAKERTAKG